MLEDSEARTAWPVMDLVLFAVFFVLTVIFLPVGLITLMRVFRPGLEIQNLTAVDQVILQGVMNLILVGFIAFLVKVVHRRPFLEYIHWFRNHTFGTGLLIAVGVTLAISVAIISSFFPPSEPPPLERLLSSTEAMYVFAIFGIGVAPLFEEIIFRGFLYKVLHDMRGPGLAIPATAGLFTMLHIPQLWGSWAGIGLIFFVGYVLSAVRERSQSIIPALVIHTAYNGVLFGLFALSTLVTKTPAG